MESKMTKEEARIRLIAKREELIRKYEFEEAEVLTVAIEALQAPPITQRSMYQAGYKQAQEDRLKGEWKVRRPKPFFLCECSVCGESEEWMSKFCPNCGADMRGEDK